MRRCTSGYERYQSELWNVTCAGVDLTVQKVSFRKIDFLSTLGQETSGCVDLEVTPNSSLIVNCVNFYESSCYHTAHTSTLGTSLVTFSLNVPV
jgi:hypothetical protein